MKRRDFMLSAAGAALWPQLVHHSLIAQGKHKRAHPPNMILVLADDVSAKEFALYDGQGIDTPVLDRMGHEGVFFQTAWTVPVCGPSRCLLRTGKYPFRTQYYDNQIFPSTPTYKSHIEIPQALHDAGYSTLMAGKNHDGTPPGDKGYDEWCLVGPWEGYDGPHQSPDWAGPEARARGMYAVQWYFHPALYTRQGGIPTGPDDFGSDMEVDYICDSIAQWKDQPFFIYWPTNLPHMMHSAERKWHYTDVPERNPAGKPTGGRIPGSLKSNVEYLDYLLGRICRALETQGLAESTIIFFAGDNGTAGYGKQRLESEIGPRVPFVVYGPGIVPALGSRLELVDFSDVLPTLIDLAGTHLPADYQIDGKSFAPLLRNQHFEGREWIFVQMNEARWLRDERWLLDGNGHFWDCGRNRNETQGYRDVTHLHDPEVIAARKQFERILQGIPPVDYDHPLTRERWEAYRQTHKKHQVYRPPYLGG
jgi:arylsulfatase A